MKIIAIGTDQKVFEKGRVFERIQEYAQICDQYTYFCFVDKKLDAIAQEKFKIIPIKSYFRIFSLLKLLFQVKSELTNDTIIYSQDAFEIGLFSYVISKFYKLKLCVQIHTDISSKYFRREGFRNFIQYLISKFLIKRADSLRVVGERIKKYLVLNGVDSDKIFVAPIFSQFINSKNLKSLKDRRNEILILSRFERVKNIPLAIKAFKLLTKDVKYNDYILKLVGDGSLRKKLMFKYKEESNIVWEKWTDNPEENFSEAKIFLITSKYEGWGMTPIESVSCGTPVVMTDVGCANEFIFSNLNGQVVSEMKASEIAKSIKHILENQDNYTLEKMQNSLNILQTKERYLQTLKKCWRKTLS